MKCIDNWRLIKIEQVILPLYFCYHGSVFDDVDVENVALKFMIIIVIKRLFVTQILLFKFVDDLRAVVNNAGASDSDGNKITM